jgi:hypothetical protein
MLDENRVHEIVGSSEEEKSDKVNWYIEDATKWLTDLAEATIPLKQTGKGWAIQHALEGGQMLTPRIAQVHWTLCEAPSAVARRLPADR